MLAPKKPSADPQGSIRSHFIIPYDRVAYLDHGREDMIAPDLL
ncbi:hypothetical protein ABZ656_50225 [Streptomyces sp. NPDC007095]|jgi:hypothetical protein